MAEDHDEFWDEMGVSWRVTIADEGLLSAGLKDRLKWQSLLTKPATIGGLLTAALGMALASWALWIGWSGGVWNMITRGFTLAAVSLVALIAAVTLRSGAGAEARSLRLMLTALIARTQRVVLAADLGCIAVLILAAGGTAGYALRMRIGHPPELSLLIDLLILALAVVALLWFRWSQANAISRYRALERAFGPAEEV